MIATAALNGISLALRIEPVTDFRAFLDLQNAWDALVDETGIDHPFLSHVWVRSWWENFGGGKQLHILLIREGTELLAVVPLMFSSARMYGLKVRQLEFIYNAHSPRCDFIVSRRPTEIYRAVWRYLLDIRASWDLIKLPQLVDGSATFNSLQKMARESDLPVGCWPSTESPYLTLAGGWEDYFGGLDRKHRSNVRSRLNRLQKIGEVEYQVVTTGAEVMNSLEEGLAIEAKGWKGRAGTAILCHSDLHNFYRAFARRAAELDWLRLHFLRVNGRKIAFDYSLFYKNKLYLLKPGYDPEFAPLSPYNLLCYMTLRDAFNQGVTEFDFLGMKDSWKLDWTDQTRLHWWLFIFSDRLRPALVHYAKFRLSPKLKQYRCFRVLRNIVLRTLHVPSRH